MKLFRSHFEQELDEIINDIKINLSNNYKSTAHSAKSRLGERCEQLFANGSIDKKHI